ncbi:MAG: rluD [Acidimicrobiia bacterium]|nr:rluD [Acidimicrobiia bacterium]
MTHVEVIPEALDGQRVDRVVAMIGSVSRAVAADLIAQGAVTLAGEVVAAGSARVKLGQELSVEFGSTTEEVALEPDPSVVFEVVYADDDVIVIDKPQGLVVHPGSGHLTGTLAQGLLARYPEIAGVGDPARPGIVHRLDKGTSGMVMVARSPRAYDSLVGQLSTHTAGREYLALVWGHFTSPNGIVDAPIGRSRRDPTKMAIVAHGKIARTRYEVAAEYEYPEALALVRCWLETGRTHQIRVHLAAIEHSVVGDPQYRGARRAMPVDRPMLHAARLSFEHPGTGEPMSFESPTPADMAAVLSTLR